MNRSGDMPKSSKGHIATDGPVHCLLEVGQARLSVCGYMVTQLNDAQQSA